MSDAIYMDFEEPDQTPPWQRQPDDQRVESTPRVTDADGLNLPIPVLPKRATPNARGPHGKVSISNRARSAVNLKIDGASYVEIAETLEYTSPEEARRDVERALAETHPIDDWRTLRATVAARAEQQFARSFAMAGADFLVDMDTDTRMPNPDKLRWHQQAGIDLMNYAKITGAQAPTRVEITPGESEMAELVAKMLEASGHRDVIEAEVIDLDVIPDEVAPEEDVDGP